MSNDGVKKWRKIEFPAELEDEATDSKADDVAAAREVQEKGVKRKRNRIDFPDEPDGEQVGSRRGIRGGSEHDADLRAQVREDRYRQGDGKVRRGPREREGSRDRDDKGARDSHWDDAPPECVGLRHHERHVFVHSVQSGLWPIRRFAASRLRAAFRKGKDTPLIFAQNQTPFVMGYAMLRSAPIDARDEDHPFTGEAGVDYVIRVDWKLFGEFAAKLFAKVPEERVNGDVLRPGFFRDGAAFSKATADAVVDIMGKTAIQYKLPSPSAVAAQWCKVEGITPWVGARRPRPPPYPPSDAAGASARDGAQPGSRSGGFMRTSERPGAERDSTPGAKGRSALPDAVVRGGPAAAAPEPVGASFAHRNLLDLSYEEYLEVYGLVEQLWRQHQTDDLRQAALKRRVQGQRQEFMTEAEYLRYCRSEGFGHLPEDDIRAFYRQQTLKMQP